MCVCLRVYAVGVWACEETMREMRMRMRVRERKISRNLTKSRINCEKI